jgi:hypothetical protein
VILSARLFVPTGIPKAVQLAHLPQCSSDAVLSREILALQRKKRYNGQNKGKGGGRDGGKDEEGGLYE